MRLVSCPEVSFTKNLLDTSLYLPSGWLVMYSTAWFTSKALSVPVVYTIPIVQECHTAVNSIGLLVGDLNAEFLYARLVIGLPLAKHL